MFHLLKAHLLHLYKILLGKFVKRTEISANMNDLSSIDSTDRCNLVEDRELVIAWIYYTTNHYEIFNEGSIDKQSCLTFASLLDNFSHQQWTI